jgi:deoxyribose-phosphate aldolase
MLQYLEYGYYDFDSNALETKSIIEEAIKYAPSTISVLPHYVQAVKKLIPDHIRLATIIDYPFGLSGYLDRENAVKSAITQGVNSIEIVCPNHALCNRKYDRFRLEIDCIKRICLEKKVDLKYIIEYKTYTLPLMHKVADILYTKKLPTIYPSTSFFMDSISDNIIVSMMLQKRNTNLNIISTGQAWTDEHVNLILSNDSLFAYKTNNIYTLEKITNKILQK